jgi:hypothetical protein
MTKAETKARALIAAQSTTKLIEQFELTELVNDSSVYTVRGWLMDELQKRDPAAFDRWIESEDESPRAHFISA